jgi:hypothetical protein
MWLEFCKSGWNCTKKAVPLLRSTFLLRKILVGVVRVSKLLLVGIRKEFEGLKGCGMFIFRNALPSQK